LTRSNLFAKAHLAIAREKQIKAGSRRKKIALIEGMNPEWKDLSKHLPELIQIASGR